MAGRGPAPKDASKRARRNADSAVRIIQTKPSVQPSLVEAVGEINPVTAEPWSDPTLRLWTALGEFPTSETLQTAQWLLLARSMMLDDALIRGEAKYAAEARLQLAKFGIAPDDVARLRYSFATADQAEEKGSTISGASKGRYQGLRLAD